MRRSIDALPSILSLGGALLALGGIALDTAIHAAQPGLIHLESPFSLTNPGHVAIGAGVLMAVAGATGVVYRDLRPRRPLIARSAVAAVTVAVLVAAVVTATAFEVLQVSPSATSEVPTTPGPPTAAQRHAAADLVTRTRRAARRFESLDYAIGLGYQVRLNSPSALLVHYENPDLLQDRYVLDPNHPQALVYLHGRTGTRLVGVMYIMPDQAETGPDIGGELTRWHVHPGQCLTPDGLPAAATGPGCPPGTFLGPGPQMLHVWTTDRFGSPFTDDISWTGALSAWLAL